MGTITGLLTGIRGTHKRATDALAELVSEKTVLYAELEGTAISFRTRILMTEDTVVLGKPSELRVDALVAGAMIRLKLPDDPDHNIRLEVSAPHVNMSSGNAVIACRLPSATLVRTKRKSKRYDVSKRGGVRLVIPQRGREFQLSDISDTGCAVNTTRMEAETYFPIGDTLRNVRIQAGSKTTIEIAELVPRAHKDRSVGFAFRIQDDSLSKNNLERVIRVLDTPA